MADSPNQAETEKVSTEKSGVEKETADMAVDVRPKDPVDLVMSQEDITKD